MTQIKTTQFKCRRPSAFKTIFIVIAIMAITYSKVYIVCAQGLSTPWSVFRHDSLHTGRSTLQGPDSNNLKWSFRTENIVDSSAVLGRDGTIYIGSQDKRLYAIKPGGTLKWSYDVGSKIFSTPAISENVIYVCAWNGKIFALDLDGKLKWKIQIKGRVSSSPVISANDNLFIGSDNYYLYKISPAGKILWAFATRKYIDSSPAIDNEGTVYFGSNDSRIYALNPDGKLKWHSKTKGQITSSPAIGPDGTIYQGSNDGRLYALNPDGDRKSTRLNSSH